MHMFEDVNTHKHIDRYIYTYIHTYIHRYIDTFYTCICGYDPVTTVPVHERFHNFSA